MFIILLLILFFVLDGEAITATGSNGACTGKVILFSSHSYQGRCLGVDGEISDLGTIPHGSTDWDNKAISLIVEPGWTAILYENTGFRGTSKVELIQDSDLNNDAIGRGTSSLRVNQRQGWTPSSEPCAGHNVILYKEKDFKGNCLGLDIGTFPDLATSNFDNSVKSIKVTSGSRAKLYENVNYGGAEFITEVEDWALSRVGWHDRISSVKVESTSASTGSTGGGSIASCGNGVRDAGEFCEVTGNIGCATGTSCAACTSCTATVGSAQLINEIRYDVIKKSDNSQLISNELLCSNSAAQTTMNCNQETRQFTLAERGSFSSQPFAKVIVRNTNQLWNLGRVDVFYKTTSGSSIPTEYPLPISNNCNVYLCEVDNVPYTLSSYRIVVTSTTTAGTTGGTGSTGTAGTTIGETQIEVEDSTEPLPKVDLVNNRNDIINGEPWDIGVFTDQGVTYARYIMDQDKFIINFATPVSGTYNLGVNAHRSDGSIQANPQILIKSGTSELNRVSISPTAPFGTRTFTWNEFKSGNFVLNNVQRLELVVNTNGAIVNNFNKGLFNVDWFKIYPVTAPTTTGASFPWVWSSAGPAIVGVGTTCLQFKEDSDQHGWQDNYLCYPLSTNLGLRWSSAGPITGLHCIQITEPNDPGTWNDNYLCMTTNLGWQWSNNGPIPGMDCLPITEPFEPTDEGWTNNHLCRPLIGTGSTDGSGTGGGTTGGTGTGTTGTTSSGSSGICSDEQTLFKMSGTTNAHASIFSKNDYYVRACVEGIQISNRICNANNDDFIISLTADTNAHVSKNPATSSPYSLGNYIGSYTTTTIGGDVFCGQNEAICGADNMNQVNTPIIDKIRCCKINGINVNSGSRRIIESTRSGEQFLCNQNEVACGAKTGDRFSGVVYQKIYCCSTQIAPTGPTTTKLFDSTTKREIFGNVGDSFMCNSDEVVCGSKVQDGTSDASSRFNSLYCCKLKVEPDLGGTNPNNICSDDLECSYRSGDCLEGESCVASLSGDDDAHVGLCDEYPDRKLCCKPTKCTLFGCGTAKICQEDEGGCRRAQCVWDTDKNDDNTPGDNFCCEPGKTPDHAEDKCIYDPDGNDVILDLDSSTPSILDHTEFSYKGKLYGLTFNGFCNNIPNFCNNNEPLITVNSPSIAVSSLPKIGVIKLCDTPTCEPDKVVLNADLNGDSIDDFRVALVQILNPDPLKGKIKIKYIVSDRGLCGGGAGSGPDNAQVEAESVQRIENNVNDGFLLEEYTFGGTTSIKNIAHNDKFLVPINLQQGTYDITVRAWRGIAPPDPKIQIKKNGAILGAITIQKIQSSGLGLTFGEFTISGVNLNSGQQTLEFIADGTGSAIQGGWGLFLLDWIKFAKVGTSNSNECSGNTPGSICNTGFAYCSLGTKCNWFPPRSKAGVGGCCPDGKKWDPTRRKVDGTLGDCIDFAPNPVCTGFGTYTDFRTTDTIRFDNVCCQAGMAYGFWDPTITYSEADINNR